MDQSLIVSLTNQLIEQKKEADEQLQLEKEKLAAFRKEFKSKQLKKIANMTQKKIIEEMVKRNQTRWRRRDLGMTISRVPKKIKEAKSIPFDMLQKYLTETDNMNDETSRGFIERTQEYCHKKKEEAMLEKQQKDVTLGFDLDISVEGAENVPEHSSTLTPSLSTPSVASSQPDV